MRIYVLCETYTDLFKDVSTKDEIVVIWAKQADKVGSTFCNVYDDVGVCEGQVDLKETARLGRVVMAGK